MTMDNLKYMTSLPTEAEIELGNGQNIQLIHNSPIFFRKLRIDAFHSSNYLTRMRVSPFTHEDYLEHARQAVLDHPEAAADLAALPPGVYAFGHNHLQWHMRSGDTLIVNPGSCGIPLDFDNRAAYTAIEDIGDDWAVDERRVEYDIDTAINALKSSSLSNEAPVWSKIIIEEIRIGAGIISHFFMHLEKIANKASYTQRPVSDEIWKLAAETFDLEGFVEGLVRGED